MILDDYFGASGSLSSHIAGFEPRAAQQEMATAVANLISGEGVASDGRARLLVVEAETGIGKTLAYLLPALLTGRKVAVSTATINLQDQIMRKEVPLLERVLDRVLSVVCLKGRQNYLCLYRWHQYYSTAQLSLVDDDECERINSWLSTTQTGDRAELDWLPDNARLWFRISAKPNQCLGGECPEWSDCFVNRVRKSAGSAQLMVVNHHLFFSDLALRQGGYGEVLPRYEGVIFDEAHHLENVATTFFGRSFSQYQLLDLFADIDSQAEADLDAGRREWLTATARGFRKRVDEFFSLFPEGQGRFHLTELIRSLGEDSWRAEVELLDVGFRRLVHELDDLSNLGEGWNSLQRRARELNENLVDIAFPSPQGEGAAYVYWYERRERSVALSVTPVDVAEHLRETLYRGVEWCVMTSATLSTGGDFTYLRERLGLGEEVDILRLLSPFDYGARTLLYVPENGFPEPSSPDHQTMACRRACELLELSGGRGMVLCTSFRTMESMVHHLREYLPYPVLAQGEGSKHYLLEQFKENRRSVLVAVASFWEGVDVPGEALTCVIIDKLPFEVPSDPVIQARIEAISERGGKPFFDFQVPRAVLTLRQGVGRLMRSIDDWGIIGILDVRLFTKSYGRTFRKSLPPSPVVRSLEHVREFFTAIEERQEKREQPDGPF